MSEAERKPPFVWTDEDRAKLTPGASVVVHWNNLGPGLATVESVQPDSVWLREGWASWEHCDPQTIQPAPRPEDVAIPMLLWCPGCRLRHIDAGEFATKPHHTHACQGCGMVWRPAIVPTVGVKFLPGFKDAEPEKSRRIFNDRIASAAIDGGKTIRDSRGCLRRRRGGQILVASPAGDDWEVAETGLGDGPWYVVEEQNWGAARREEGWCKP